RGRIYDYTAANSSWFEKIRDFHGTRWEEYEQAFRPLFKEVDGRFKSSYDFNDFYTLDDVKNSVWPSLRGHPKLDVPLKVLYSALFPNNAPRRRGEAVVLCTHRKYPMLIQVSDYLPATFRQKGRIV